MERLMKQGLDPMTGKDRIGQDIEERSYGKLAPATSCKVVDVNRNAPNFHRATINVNSSTDVKGVEFDELKAENNSDNTRDSELSTFEKGADSINENAKDVIKGGR
jgi:hypothetical protein